MWRKLIISSLLLPVTVFGTITVTDRGTGNDTVSSTTLVLTMKTMAAGSTGILTMACDNAAGITTNYAATSYTDTAGNVWYLVSNGVGGSAGTVAEGAVFASVLTASTSSSNTLTITFNAATATNFSKAWTWIEAAPTAGNMVLWTQGFVWPSSAATGTPASGSFTANTNELILGCAAAESNTGWTTGDVDTTNGSWSATPQTDIANTGTLLTSIQVISQTKIASAYGVQAYNPTLTSCDVRATLMVFVETDPKAVAVSGNSTATQTTTTATFQRPMAASSIGVLAIAVDNNNTGGAVGNFPSSFNDSKSNTWTRQQNGVYNPASSVGTGVEVAIYTGAISTPIVPGDTVQWTYSTAGVTGKAWVIWGFPRAGTGAMSYVSGAVGAGATTTSPTITTSSITNGDYVVGVVGIEGPNTFVGDAGTTNGTWKTIGSLGIGSGNTAMSIGSQWKQVTATATQIYNPTCSSVDTLAAWVSIHDSSTVGLTAGQKSGFFLLFP